MGKLSSIKLVEYSFSAFLKDAIFLLRPSIGDDMRPEMGSLLKKSNILHITFKKKSNILHYFVTLYIK